MKEYEQRRVIHAGTFNGYPLGLAAVRITYEILEEGDGIHFMNMKKYSKRLHDIFVEKATNIGLPMVIQGPGTCASYHCTDTVLTNPAEYSAQLKFRDMIINGCLAKHGILVSIISRMYSNISLNDVDIEFFEEKLTDGLVHAKATLDTLPSSLSGISMS